MTAAWMWARSAVRTRWRSWVVLGLLAGVSAGIAMSAIAGARRTSRAVERYISAGGGLPEAAVLANDPAFDDAKRAELAALPYVEQSYPFFLQFGQRIVEPPGLDGFLVPTEPQTAAFLVDPLVDGRPPDPARADEVIVNETARDEFGLDIGSTIVVTNEEPDNPKATFTQEMRVVGIRHSPGDSADAAPSVGYYRKYRDRMFGATNAFVDLKPGASLDQLRGDMQRIVGRPVNVESTFTMFGVTPAKETADIEAAGLLLFAIVVIVGAGALVGQALVRAVSAGADELPTWRALGADRQVVVRAMVLPTLITALMGALAGIVLAVALSPRYPIATTRLWEIHHRVRFDWLVLGLGAFALTVAVVGAAWVTAEVRVRRSERIATRSAASRFIANADVSPALLIGSQLATEPGRGRRAVPVRSALVGAIVGVLGFVGCLTFRAGLTDAVDNKARTGVVWDHALVSTSRMPADVVTRIGDDPAVDRALNATWARAVEIDGTGQPVWFTAPVTGEMPFVIVDGRAPRGPDEIVFGPSTLAEDGFEVGDTVDVGPGTGRPVKIVGTALLPPSSHTTYDQAAWMSSQGLDGSVRGEVPDDFFEDYVLFSFKPGADRDAALRRLEPLAEYSEPAQIAPAVVSLGHMRSLPFALAIFFVLLACATVAHALVTTVRRRERDFAVLRAMGFTRRNTRFAIAWQATVLATIGVLVGVPLGVVAGRLAWRQLAEDFPVFYSPPLALVAVIVVIPLAIVVANVLAAGPARSATRMRPAEVLRTE